MKLETKYREITGKKVKKLRRDGDLPGVVFSKNEDSINISINKKNFINVFKEAGETSVIELTTKKDSLSVLIRGYQIHPVTSDILHVDFYKVNLKEKTNAVVPIRFEGEPLIVKSGDAIVLEILNEVEVECLPTDIPNEIVVDISGLEDMDTIITIKDLVYDKEKVEIVGYEENDAIVKLDYAEMEEEEVEEEITEEEAIEGIEASKEKIKEEEEEEEDKKPKPKEDKK